MLHFPEDKIACEIGYKPYSMLDHVLKEYQLYMLQFSKLFQTYFTINYNLLKIMSEFGH